MKIYSDAIAELLAEKASELLSENFGRDVYVEDCGDGKFVVQDSAELGYFDVFTTLELIEAVTSVTGNRTWARKYIGKVVA